MKVINNLLLFTLAVTVLVACKKERNDGEGPVITWSSPAELSTFFSVDTFLVNATVTDPDGIARVLMQITTPNGETVASLPAVFPNQNSHTVNQLFYLNRADLAGGVYYMNAKASDGHNESSSFLEIHIEPIPWEVRNTFLAAGSTSNSSVELFDFENGESEILLTQAGDVRQMFANHLAGSVYVVSGNGGRIRALEYPDYNTQWTYDIPNNTAWNGIECASFNGDLRQLIVADSERQFRVLNEAGSVILGFESDLFQYRTQAVLMNADRIFAIERRLDGSDQQLSTFYKASGALVTRLYFPGEVTALYAAKSSAFMNTWDELYAFLTLNGQPTVRRYRPATGSIDEPVSLPGGTLGPVCQIGNKDFLVQIDQTIYRINFTGPLQISYDGEAFNTLVFDPVNNEVLATTASSLVRLGISGGALQELATYPIAGATSLVQLRNR